MSEEGAIDRRTNQKTLVDVLAKKEKDFKETLERLVGKLNANFALFMQNIHCQGSVDLINRDSFSTIGLDIKVSFRADQEVQSLNGMVQSGGVGLQSCTEWKEKSLSTILFLLSLQEMVSFPFRFIDEVCSPRGVHVDQPEHGQAQRALRDAAAPLQGEQA